MGDFPPEVKLQFNRLFEKEISFSELFHTCKDDIVIILCDDRTYILDNQIWQQRLSVRDRMC